MTQAQPTIAFRADQVGSLLRPPSLLEARADRAAGRITPQQLRGAEDAAILQVLERQRATGLEILTDGEFRRGAWQTDLAEAVEGFQNEYLPMAWYGPNAEEAGDSAAHVVGGPLRQTRRITAHETAFLKEHAGGAWKMTLPSAATFSDASFKPGLTDRFYPTRGDLLNALVPIIGAEIRALVDEGAAYVQIDAPRYTYYADERHRARMLANGVDPDRALADGLAADNATLQGVPRERAVLALHLCRGNSRSRWRAEGGYDRIAEQIFAGIDVDRFLLEYDTERAGGFEPLRFVPPGKTVVLGLVTTKQGTLERQDDLLRRIEEASQYLPVERLALSPQCGFASVADGNRLTEDEQWRKLELVVDTARKVWG
jgi:5-methyltetrahydropteroyltriglutamate--homocysteine methyltransferase